MKGLIKAIARRLGYRIQHVPAIFRLQPDIEYRLRLEHLAALQFCRHRDFFFVQVGANDGSTVDPIHQMVRRYQWRGMLIEPEPRAFAALQETYRDAPQLTMIQAAIGPVDGSVTFYRVRPDVPGLPDKAPLVSSLDRAMLLRNIGAEFSPFVEGIEVPGCTLTSLFRQHGITRVDLLQIDAEGYDLKVLQSLDFSTVHPGVISFEHALLSPADQLTAWQFLAERGYQLFIRPPDTMACCAFVCGD